MIRLIAILAGVVIVTRVAAMSLPETLQPPQPTPTPQLVVVEGPPRVVVIRPSPTTPPEATSGPSPSLPEATLPPLPSVAPTLPPVPTATSPPLPSPTICVVPPACGHPLPSLCLPVNKPLPGCQ